MRKLYVFLQVVLCGNVLEILPDFAAGGVELRPAGVLDPCELAGIDIIIRKMEKF